MNSPAPTPAASRIVGSAMATTTAATAAMSETANQGTVAHRSRSLVPMAAALSWSGSAMEITIAQMAKTRP